jgi:hypothetical protein
VNIHQEVDEEIAFHIEMRTRELVARGMDPKAARDVVLARLGDVGRLKRTCVDLGRKREREMRITQWIDEFVHDVTFTIRQLKSPPPSRSSLLSRWRLVSERTARCSPWPMRPCFDRCHSGMPSGSCS